ncbi:MAG: alpha/beta hydrolase [Eubacteriales bacterium]
MLKKIIDTPRGKVHYWVSLCNDDKVALVFSHGVTADNTLFDKQVEYFEGKYNLITWDIPLHGLSCPYSDFSYQHCAEDLCAILDAENIKKAVLVGMSLGGYPSQVFAEKFPERTAGLIALDTTPFGHKYYSKTDIWLLKRIAAMSNLYSEKALKRSMAKAVSRTAYSFDAMSKMLARSTKAEIIKQMDIAYRVFIEENHDTTITCPLLILLGDHDKTGKVKQYCEEWAKDTGAPLVIIKNAAHFANGDNPEQVNAAIERFVKGL